VAVAILILFACAVHYALGWTVGWLNPDLSAQRPFLMGLVGGLCGALVSSPFAGCRGTS
jgi:hypothetical protein